MTMGSPAWYDCLNASSLGHGAGLALQLAVKVLDGVLVFVNCLQVGDVPCQVPHLLTLCNTDFPSACTCFLLHYQCEDIAGMQAQV